MKEQGLRDLSSDCYRILILFVVAVAAVVLVLNLESENSFSTNTGIAPTKAVINNYNNKTSRSPTSNNNNNSVIDVEYLECRLPFLDPWDDYALPFIDRTIDPLKGCKVTFTPITYLKQGRIFLIEKEKEQKTKCEYQCLYPKNDYVYIKGPLKKIGDIAECDVMEVNCTRPNSSFSYNILHSQIYRKNQTYPLSSVFSTTTRPDVLEIQKNEIPKKPSQPPDVHILLFDSVSTTQFIRSMSASLNVLKDEMEGIIFPHSNKVGLNSRPNGYALLLGRQGYEMEKSPINNKRKPWKNLDEYCKQDISKDQFIGFEFQKKGYVSLISDDWAQGALTWPYCEGFSKTPADHYFKPFQLRFDYYKYANKNKTMLNKLFRESCRGRHEYQVDYLKQFIDAYPDKPKFSLTWFTELAHGSTNGLFHVDLYFKKFLRSYKEKFRNSFLFIMGDHGNRNDLIHKSKLGETEDKSPLLLVVLPEHLRGNENLIRNMKRNAKQLTTHFDTYATLVNIAHEASKFESSSVFNGFNHSEIPLHIEGESYLHPFKQDKPRNCNNLHIPFDFCTCQMEEKDISTELQFGRRMASYMVEEMNKALEENNQTNKCSYLSLNSSFPVQVLEFEPKLKFNAYKVTFKVLPGNGHVWGYVQANGQRNSKGLSFSMISEKLARLDKYEPTAFCIQGTVKPYCYCNELLGKSKGTTTDKPVPKVKRKQ